MATMEDSLQESIQVMVWKDTFFFCGGEQQLKELVGTTCCTKVEGKANLRSLCVRGLCLPAKWQRWKCSSGPTSGDLFLPSFLPTQFFPVAVPLQADLKGLSMDILFNQVMNHVSRKSYASQIHGKSNQLNTEARKEWDTSLEASAEILTLESWDATGDSDGWIM